MLIATKNEVERLSSDLEQFAQPVGVVSAIVILAIYSVLGTVLPLIVMGMEIDRPPIWLWITLLSGFVAGLASVLRYIGWYLRLIRY
jgi:hypothetical protein